MAFNTLPKAPVLPGRKHQPAILAPETLKKLLHEERERANRSGSQFSFLLFNMKGFGSMDRAASGFVRELFDRVRSIDKVGWMEDDAIGVILPYTPASGARLLADELIELPGTGDRPISFTVYTYPFSMYEG